MAFGINNKRTSERFGGLTYTYDIAFLFSGLLSIIIGYFCIRTERHRELIFPPLHLLSPPRMNAGLPP